MPKYGYTAVDLQNNKVNDIADAKDYDDLKKILRDQNLVLIRHREIEDSKKSYRLKANENADFSRQIASMLGSGITVVRALEILKDRDFAPRLREVYEKIYKDVQQGSTLSEAMKLQEGSFPPMLVNMYASGEASGQLEQVAKKMGVHYDKEHHLNGKIKTAMTYPTILLVVTVVVVMLVFTVILPSFFEMFEDMELPAITQAIVGISKFLQTYWYLVMIGVLCVAAAWQYLIRIRSFALKVDMLKLRVPVIGKLLKIIYTARFARTLASLYTSGISIIGALELTRTIISNKFIEDQFDELTTDVRNGELLSAAIGKIKEFDKKLSTTILIGEESGRLDTMLESTAESFDYEAEMATGRLVQLVEPIMIVIMAVVIGAIMLAVMLPLISLYQSTGNM